MNEAEQKKTPAQGIWREKTCPELSVPTKEPISASYSKKPQKWPANKPPLFLFLKTDGQQPDTLPIWEENGALRGEYLMHSFGACPKDENASHLSQILEDSPHPKYSLSAKACRGILNRAEKRGKALPEILKTTLTQQALPHLTQTCAPAVSGPITFEPGFCSRVGGHILQDEKAPSLRAEAGDNQPAVAPEHPLNDSRLKIAEDGVVQTLNARMGTGGGNVPLVMCFNCVIALHLLQDPITDENITPCLSAGSTKGEAALGVCLPVGIDGYNAALTGDKTATLGVNCGCSTGRNGVCENKETQYIVRRLTPLECERLQGYPDNWTDIGEWVDRKGKVHKESADSARYKALGNSIAIPPWTYVLQRLSFCCGSKPTMASLFDGIGGFPYIWENLNGKGSCVWASEIEEFPIAVTEYHFPGDAEN